MSALLKDVNEQDEFELSADAGDQPAFELEALQPESDHEAQPLQAELYLPEDNAENPELPPQFEFEGMARPVFSVALDDGRAVRFQHAHSLLESLEAQDVDVHYQCREGYCGSCRAQLLEGDVHYNTEPMAWLNDGEILPCCCIPKSHIKIKL
ncbi:class I ribonucleotide reductase maintenance protein YfaE [Thalassolituus marinus]